jgi:hypothetical protein
VKPKIIVLSSEAEAPRDGVERLCEITCEQTLFGWVARCEETGLTAFGSSPEMAASRLIQKSASAENS